MVAFGEVLAHELRPDAERRQGAAQGSRFRPLAVVRELGRGLDDAMGIAIAKPAQPPFDFEIVIVDGRVVARGATLHFAWEFDEMGLGVEHRLVLHGENFIEAGIDGRQHHLVPAVPELAAVDGDLAIEAKHDQAIERVGLGIGLGGDPAVDDGQHIAGVDPFQGRLDALRLLGLVVVDLIGGGNVDAIG
jgi:hypothetical protein